jgi:hypothetical protein
MPVHGPIHAVWLNQIEIYFCIVQRKPLTLNDFPALPAIARRRAEFESYCGSIAHSFEWKCTRFGLNALLACIRSGYGQTQQLKLAA